MTKPKEINTAGTIFPISDRISYDKLSTPHRAFVTSITNLSEPRNYQEAMTSPEWCDAMKAEIKALELNDTWVLADLPPDKNYIIW